MLKIYENIRKYTNKYEINTAFNYLKWRKIDIFGSFWPYLWWKKYEKIRKNTKIMTIYDHHMIVYCRIFKGSENIRFSLVFVFLWWFYSYFLYIFVYTPMISVNSIGPNHVIVRVAPKLNWTQSILAAAWSRIVSACKALGCEIARV
jgi:hypothetical protein